MPGAPGGPGQGPDGPQIPSKGPDSLQEDQEFNDLNARFWTQTPLFSSLLVDQMGERIMPYLTLDATWKTRVISALNRQAPQTHDQSRQKRLTRALENLRKQHLWGDLSDENYKLERQTLERQLKLVAVPIQPTELPNLERSAQLLEDMQVLWSHKGVTDEQREALVREVFNRITIEGKQFMSIEPKPAYAPLFASIATNQELGYWEPKSP